MVHTRGRHMVRDTIHDLPVPVVLKHLLGVKSPKDYT